MQHFTKLIICLSIPFLFSSSEKANAEPSMSKIKLQSAQSPGAVLTNAITRDNNGNGFLDAIEIHFNAIVTILPEDTARIRINYSTIAFQNVSISGKGGSSTDSAFILTLKEDSTSIWNYNRPSMQTGWLPYISFNGRSGIADVFPFTFLCTDGAGPVLAYIERYVFNPVDITQDEIRVYFSEPVAHLDGSALAVGDTASRILRTCLHNISTGGCDSVNILGANIIEQVYSDSALFFHMTNGQAVSSLTLFNINPVLPLIADMSPGRNQPTINNRKVRISIISAYHPIAGIAQPFSQISALNPAYQKDIPYLIYSLAGRLMPVKNNALLFVYEHRLKINLNQHRTN